MIRRGYSCISGSPECEVSQIGRTGRPGKAYRICTACGERLRWESGAERVYRVEHAKSQALRDAVDEAAMRLLPAPEGSPLAEGGPYVSVREEPELRHVFAHMLYAIRALAGGHVRVAEYEVAQVEGLVMWDDDSDEAVERWLAAKEERDAGEAQGRQEVVQGEEELSGEEELQGEEEEVVRRLRASGSRDLIRLWARCERELYRRGWRLEDLHWIEPR